LTLSGLRGRVAHAPPPCEPCGGGAVASRAHMLWECPPAVVVRGALQKALARRGCAVLERHHVWLMHCPDPALHADQWPRRVPDGGARDGAGPHHGMGIRPRRLASTSSGPGRRHRLSTGKGGADGGTPGQA
jgi:hypothetical protein